MSIQHRLKRFFVLSAIGLALGAVIGLVSLTGGGKDGGHQMMSAKIDGTFSLVDQDGAPKSEKDYADKYKLIYFGFTYCPAICPTELSKMTEAYLALSLEEQAKVQPIFISVDPERDTPQVLKGYVGLFMPQLMGLTGTVAQVESAKKNFRVYATKVPEGDSYTIDHSSMMYFLTPAGDTIAIFKNADTADQLTARIKAVLSS